MIFQVTGGHAIGLKTDSRPCSRNNEPHGITPGWQLGFGVTDNGIGLEPALVPSWADLGGIQNRGSPPSTLIP